MSVKIKERNENQYLYFQRKDGKAIFLGKIGEISKYPDRVTEALDVLLGKDSSYFEYEKKLLSILPPAKQKNYVPKIIKKVEEERIDLLSLSPSVSMQYKPKGQVKAEEETRHRRLELLQKRFLSDPLCYTLFCTLWIWYIHQKLVEMSVVFIETEMLSGISKMQENEIKKSTDLMVYFEILRRHEDYRRPGFFYTLKSTDLFDHITDRFLKKFATGDKTRSLIVLFEFVSGLISNKRSEKQYEEKLGKLLLPNEIELIFTSLTEHLEKDKFGHVTKTIDSSSNKVKKLD